MCRLVSIFHLSYRFPKRWHGILVQINKKVSAFLKDHKYDIGILFNCTTDCFSGNLMGTEIELKLIIESKSVDVFFHLPLIAEFASGACKVKRLFSRYYDTPDYLLWTHGTALRVRQDGNDFIQTLKRKGQSVQGLSERDEWEWLLNDSVLDYSLVPLNIWPPALQDRLPELQPIFNTEFKRSVWVLELPEGALAEQQDAAMVEMVLDQGNIEAKTKAERKTESILEVELELKKGVSAALFHLSKEIAEYVPVIPSNISKAERGYRLLGRVYADH